MGGQIDGAERRVNAAERSDPSIKAVMNDIELEIDKAEKQVADIRRGVRARYCFVWNFAKLKLSNSPTTTKYLLLL